MEVINREFVYINSRDTLNFTTNQLQSNISSFLPKDKKYNRITVTQIAMPISYYLIPSGYNTFTLLENGVNTVITIPAGNYNINSFCVVVAGLLNSNSPNHLAYTMTYDQSFTQVGNGLISYTVNSSAYPIGFIFNAKNNVNEQFGFSSGSTTLFAAGKLTSVDIVMFSPENTIFIHSNIVSSGNSDVLQEIYSQNNEPFSYISWINPAPLQTSKPIARQTFESITLTFTDENGIAIFFNGSTVCITLMFYEDLELGKKILSYMKYLLEKEIGNVQKVEEEKKKLYSGHETLTIPAAQQSLEIKNENDNSGLL